MQNDVYLGVGQILLDEEQENHKPKSGWMVIIVQNTLYWWNNTQTEMDNTHQSSC